MRRGLWLAMALVLVIASLPSMAPATETAPPVDAAPVSTTTTTTTSSTTAVTTTTTVADTGVFDELPAIGISTDSLIVRDAPSADGTYIGGLATGSDVLVYAKEGGWYRIRYNSADVGWTQQAYVNADYIVPVEDAPPVLTATKATTTTTKKTGVTTTTTATPTSAPTGSISGDRGVATGSFVWPVPGWKRITQSYHSGHKAIDVYENAMLGSPIVAVDGGTVVMCKTSGYNNRAGIYIQIDHGNGYKSHYCHCAQLLFKQGDSVATAEVMDKLAPTVNTTSPRLHLEMWKSGVSINPLSVLPY